ncbi:CRISPR-associated endonuclease Cas2 [Candidatus Saccharibacteria bacterium]|nr:CRISPR-associated endonuclease Cas2 [Candidatus Saccharibacteria bacterium]
MQVKDYRGKKHPALIYVLRGLLPYTRENMLLSFKPSTFFYELERVSGFSENTLRSTYYRARRDGLIAIDVVPILTEKGLRKVVPYEAKKLGNQARLIVLFDVPEHRVVTRNAFRRLLRGLGFEMVQQSVWVTDKDFRSILLDAVAEFDLKDCVEIHESVRLFPKS